MVRQQVVDRAVLPHRHPLAPGIVVLFHRTRDAGQLEAVSHVDRGYAVHHLFD